MGFSSVFVLDARGKPIISRDYRGDIPAVNAERFVARLLETEDDLIKPIEVRDGVTYLYIKEGSLYFVALTAGNDDAAMILLSLRKLVEVLKDYYGEVSEESIKDNFVVTYELFDEVFDFGYPQMMETKVLQEYIMQSSFRADGGRGAKVRSSNKAADQVRPPVAATGAVSWRTEGLKYRKNEVFLDVVEKMNLQVSATGQVLRSEVVGAIQMKTFLSGMPDLKLGLNDKVLFENTGRSTRGKAVDMEDVKFHQCVRLSRFESDRTISFVPPDGEFELMSYRLNTNVKPLFWVEALVEPHKGSRVEYRVKVKSQFKSRSTALNVEIHVPVPADADTPKFKASTGSVRYAPEEDAVIWTIKQFPGRKEYLLKAHFGLPSIQADEPEGRPPISMKFEVPYFTVSGVQVRYLKVVEKSGYQALPWVRYITTNGSYEFRSMQK